MAATFAQKTLAELSRKAGAVNLEVETATQMERVFESNGGSWQRIATGDAEMIGLLKQVVRGVLSGKIKLQPAPTPMAHTAEDLGLLRRISGSRTESTLKHHLRAAYDIATEMDVDVHVVADRFRRAIDQIQFSSSGRVHDAALPAVNQLITAACSVGMEILKDAQAVRAWQVDGGADHPFDARVAANDPILKRAFRIEDSTYRGPWDTLSVLSSSKRKLAVEPLAYLRERVETRLATFFESGAEALEAVVA